MRNVPNSLSRASGSDHCLQDLEGLSVGGWSVDLYGSQEFEVCLHSERAQYDADKVAGHNSLL